MHVRRKAVGDWQLIEALAKDGYGWEDIVVILRQEASRGRRPRTTVTPEQIRNYVIKGIRPR
jgi:glycerol-3-phosphate cytidylyltransferase-like family protein